MYKGFDWDTGQQHKDRHISNHEAASQIKMLILLEF